MNVDIKELSLELSGTGILHRISMEIPDRSFTSLVGPNGSGKSTILRAIAKNINGYSGYISEVNKDELSYLPQGLSPPPFLNISEVVHTGFYSSTMNKRKKLSAVNELLEMCGIYDIRYRRFEDISVGEQQRTWLAFALAQSKDLILMDEPLSSIDLASRQYFYKLLREVSYQGKTLLVVTHDIDMAIRYSHKIILIEDGRNAYEGNPTSFKQLYM